jgi:hypothetical protein
VRSQYGHIIDMVPTVLDLLGIDPPAAIRGVPQSPMHGSSLAYSFEDAAAPTHHRTQYFEMFGHRAIDHDGWRAVCPWPGPSFEEAGLPFGSPISPETLLDLDANHWELYHVAEDPSENEDLADTHRDKLNELIAMWYVEAERYDVFPLDGSAFERMMAERPQIAEARTSYTYRPGTQTVPFYGAPRLLNRPHSFTADVEIAADGETEGVLLCQGSAVGGWSFYVKDARLHYAHNYVRRGIYSVSSPAALPAGRHELRFEFEPTGEPDFAAGKGAPGRAQLYVDSELVAETDMAVTTPVILNPGGLTCGADPGSPVSPDYEAPFRFTGKLHEVIVDVSGDLIADTESEIRAVMGRQ